MPEFALHCTRPTCQHRFDSVHSMSARGAQHPRCPKCGAETEVDWQRQGTPRVASDELHGTRRTTIETRCQPHEVRELRQLFGDSGRCWQDDGSVRFEHKSDAAKFYKREAALEGQFAERKAEGKMGPTRKEKNTAARKRLEQRTGVKVKRGAGAS